MTTENTSTAVAEIEQLSKVWCQAELTGDTGTLAELLHPDFLAVGPRGFLLTKEQWIGRHSSGDLRYTEVGWDEAVVRVFGDTVISVAVQAQQATFQGRPIPGSFRVTQTAVRLDGRWVIAGVHLSALDAPRTPAA
ncbi:nuclear transport factor 2 family protein [Kitasatospora viridis]|uniref:Uncharacterized protein DUF4440 n=1 Tax=Kitasatospora viridis TaxID=281105 RepID=A0A561UCE3_9ACTN|nr:nuclear transport factor 2 family protein [Kitasatospora viridis]TWF97031.1 uncharacterized protein DUF4440 [Kitasatospora viridis]